MDEFFRTPMGRTFFDRTMPELVRQLEQLNHNIKELTRVIAQKQGAQSHGREDSATK